jgi:hypothetical protein
MTDEEFMAALAKAMPAVFRSDRWVREPSAQAIGETLAAKMVNRHVPGCPLVLDIWRDGTWWNYEFDQKPDFDADLEGTWFENDGILELTRVVDLIRGRLGSKYDEAEREFDRVKALYVACFI